MATATSIEIKRAKDQETAARQLEEINARLDRIERALEVLMNPSAPIPSTKGRAVPSPAAP